MTVRQLRPMTADEADRIMVKAGQRKIREALAVPQPVLRHRLRLVDALEDECDLSPGWFPESRRA